jgi:NCS1 family nucleobase:cation symporter-1
MVLITAMIALCIATLATNIAANVVSPANDFAQLAPRRISFRIGGLITGILGIVIMPWKLVADPSGYIFTWLVAYSALLGAIAGVLICDYWILRKTTLDLPALYDPKGGYSFGGSGYNWRAVAALTVAISPCIPGFVHAVSTPGGQVAHPGIWDSVYTYAWFVTFALAFALYYLLMRGSMTLRASTAVNE